MASIKDVAKRLSLSITTVSRALDGYDDVSDETRRLVLQTAYEMGYSPNQAARQLRRRRTDTIGYILPADTSSFSDPFFSEFLAGLGDETGKQGYDLLVASAPPGSVIEKQAYGRWIRSRKVDGFVLNRLHLYDWRVQYLGQAKFPFVTLERSLDPYDYPSIEVNSRHWVRLLVDHLVYLGHKNIAFIGGPAKLKISVDRFNGYRDGLEANKLSFNPDLVITGDLTTDGGYRAAKLLFNLEKPPTAISCVDDLTAIGVLHAAREDGYIVGKNLAVAGFDGIEGFEHTQPPLTTINQPVYNIAVLLVQMLVSQILKKTIIQNLVQIDPIFEIRESTIGDKEHP